MFVNVSRAGVVDLVALVARAKREDAWFGIDVHDPEPIAVDSPLIGLRNVFLPPHIDEQRRQGEIMLTPFRTSGPVPQGTAPAGRRSGYAVARPEIFGSGELSVAAVPLIG
ncbi:MAG TPA: NAD(P)-dependent oxidoreductase [Propionibacteriaceae bacterium]|nr:NAD(P)-dependent oxidoreductase [Propionibacteriaceae bacterium]